MVAGDAGSVGSRDAASATGLGGSDGITGTFGGVVHAFTVNPVHVPQQTPTVLIGAASAMFPPSESWAVRFRPVLGRQACNGSDGENDPAISFRSTARLDLNGTTGTLGACSIDVTSLSPKYEGTFTATLPTGSGNLEVVDGEFRVPN